MRRKALIVGLESYQNPRHNLQGVCNDVAAAVRLMMRFGIDDLQILRDANATTMAIQTGLNALVDRPMPGDVFVFYFTGHGALLPAGFAGADDRDGRDEALVPYEATTSALILDNWLGALVRERVPPESGAFFYGIYDCCHSGDLYKSIAFGLQPANPKLFEVKDGEEEGQAIKEVDLADLAFTGAPAFTRKASLKTFIEDGTLSNSIHIGASEPEQTALVVNIDGKRRSIFTWALEQIARPGMTIAEFEQEVTAKQATKTSHHRPVVAASASVKARRFLE
jgi:hypothetical protein